MREILFRGKITQDQWVYGFYENVKLKEATIHYVNGKIVIPKTVGQFTCLTDKNGKKIFEGDMVHAKYWRETPFIVKYEQSRGGYYPFASGDGCGCCEIETISPNENGQVLDVEVIGNIHDNPELLEQ